MRFSEVSDRFAIPVSTFSDHVEVFVDSVNLLVHKFITWPRDAKLRRTIRGFKALGSKQNFEEFDEVIGAIDGSYFKIKTPSKDTLSYFNRHHYASMTLQAVCNHKMAFTDIFVGFSSAVNDATIYQCSDLHQSISKNLKKSILSFVSHLKIRIKVIIYLYALGNTKIFGDKAYPLKSYLIVPFKDYGNLTPVQKNFNYLHSRTRITIKRAFGLFFGRFRRFEFLQMTNLKRIPNHIMTACVLHNICIKHNKEQLNLNDMIQEGRNICNELVRNVGSETISFTSPEGIEERNRMI